MTDNIVNGLDGMELNDFALLVNNTIKGICLFADEYNFDRNNMLSYFAETMISLSQIATIKNLKF